MDATMQRRQRRATPQRWKAALGRALAEGVEVWRLAGSGAWVATSGTDAAKAYELAVVGGAVRGCSCPAGDFGAPCCELAVYYHAAGLLDPEPPTPAAP
ncbi:MAG: hypothetical protein M3Q10_14340, partial [Chloroflexota bacterium]|nr:hypothetical protein [Chloroflexota bacterium]